MVAVVPWALVVLLGCAVWYTLHGSDASVDAADRPAAVSARSFPSWVEVPHLADPTGDVPARGEEGPRSFLGPPPAAKVDLPLHLPPRANPRLPLVGLVPLDIGTWSPGLTVDRDDAGRTAPTREASVLRGADPADAVALRGPDAAGPGHDVGAPLAPAVATLPPPELAAASASPEAEASRNRGAATTGMQPPPTASLARPASVATFDPAPQALRSMPAGPAVQPPVVDGPTAETRPPGPAKRAWSPRLRRGRSPLAQGDEGPGRLLKNDSGMIVRAPTRPTGSAPPNRSPEFWSLPPALGPTD